MIYGHYTRVSSDKSFQLRISDKALDFFYFWDFKLNFLSFFRVFHIFFFCFSSFRTKIQFMKRTFRLLSENSQFFQYTHSAIETK